MRVIAGRICVALGLPPAGIDAALRQSAYLGSPGASFDYGNGKYFIQQRAAVLFLDNTPAEPLICSLPD